MGFGKSLTKIIALSSMLGALAFGVPKESKAETSLYFYNKIGIEYNAIGTNFATTDSGLTLSPASPGDPASKYPGNFSLEENFGVGFVKNNLNFKIGPTLRACSNDYDNFRKAPKIFFLPTPGISFETDYLFENGLDCFLEYSSNFFNEFSNGTFSESFSLADIIEHRIKGGISGPFKKAGLFLELYIPQIINITNAGREIGLKVSPSFSAGVFLQLTNEQGNRWDMTNDASYQSPPEGNIGHFYVPFPHN
jgi:hypothetical protein